MLNASNVESVGKEQIGAACVTIIIKGDVAAVTAPSEQIPKPSGIAAFIRCRDGFILALDEKNLFGCVRGDALHGFLRKG